MSIINGGKTARIFLIASIVILAMLCCSCSIVRSAAEEDQARFDKALPSFEVINQVVLADDQTREEDEELGSFYEVDIENSGLGYILDNGEQITLPLTEKEMDAISAIAEYFESPFYSVCVFDDRIIYRVGNTFIIYTVDGRVPKYYDTERDVIGDHPLIKYGDHWYYYYGNSYSYSSMLALSILSVLVFFRIPIIAAIIAVIALLIIRRRRRKKAALARMSRNHADT